MSFLGIDGLTAIRDSTVAIVGCGGGGSHIAEQLARLSVGRIYLVDHDRLDRSNLSRVIGSSAEDVGEPKTEIIARRLSWTRTDLVPISSRVQSPEAIAALQASDYVFGSVDRFRARDDIERVCRQALVTLIDIGLGIRVERNVVVSAAGQVVLSIPGEPCMRCMEVVNETNLARDKEEYVEGGAPDQQVISMNGLLASEAVNLFLALATGYSIGLPLPRYLVYNALRHELAPHPFFGTDSAICPHYPLEDAGDRVGVA